MLTIPFNKKIDFLSPIKEICSISLEQEITNNDSNLLGNFILTGTYKEHELSINETPFSFNIPFDVNLPENVIKDSIKVIIDNFTYDIDDTNLNINIDLNIDYDEELFMEIEREEEIIPTEEIIEEPIIEEKETLEPLKENDRDYGTNIEFVNDYVTYHVHFVKENETIEQICEKYKQDIDIVKKLNNIDSIKKDDKILIPLDYE